MSATDPQIPILIGVVAGAYLLWAIYRRFTGANLRASEEAILALAIGWGVAALPIAVLILLGGRFLHGQAENVLFGAAALWGVAWAFGAILMAAKALNTGQR